MYTGSTCVNKLKIMRICISVLIVLLISFSQTVVFAQSAEKYIHLEDFFELTQGSTYSTNIVENTIDNDLSTWNHTLNDEGNWIQFTIREGTEIDSLLIFNRRSGNSSTLARLEGAKVYLSYKPFTQADSLY